jgi:predicted RNase H-related nuclease YkuK (DUF458 family)
MLESSSLSPGTNLTKEKNGMNTTYKRLGDHKKVDLIPYIKESIGERTDVKIYVGTDSQNIAYHTQYATVIVLHFGNSGGHVLYAKERLPIVRDSFTRLWKEVEMSLSIAEFMREGGLPRVDYIDLDLNPDPKYRSNMVLRSALGYVESMGYTARCKPNAPMASSVADSICH